MSILRLFLAASALLMGWAVGPRADPIAAHPGTLLWLSGLDATRAEAQLDHFQQYNVTGFLLSHVYAGSADDFLNGGAIREPGYAAQVTQLVQDAQAHGMTDLYLRLNGQVLARSHPAASRYKIDITSQDDMAAIAQTFHNDAALARQAGLAGIWIDAEPYDYGYQWRQEEDASMPAARLDTNAVRLAYFMEGVTAMDAALQADPDIQIILSPAFGYEGSGPSSVYEHYADFYAGMVGAAMKAHGKGLILATEGSYGQPAGSAYGGIYKYEDGISPIGIHHGVAIYSNLVEALTFWSHALNQPLLAWHFAHSSVALSSWPDALTRSKGMTLAGWAQAITQIRAYVPAAAYPAPRYHWIYDQRQTWWGDQYDCDLGNGQIVAVNMDCYGLVLGAVLAQSDGKPVPVFTTLTPTPAPTDTETPTALVTDTPTGTSTGVVG